MLGITTVSVAYSTCAWDNKLKLQFFDRILQNDFHLKSSFDKTKCIFNPSRVRWRVIAIGLCACVSVCYLVIYMYLGECFVLLLVQPIAGKNVSPSDKQLW